MPHSNTSAYEMSNDELRDTLLDLAAAALDKGVVSRPSLRVSDGAAMSR